MFGRVEIVGKETEDRGFRAYADMGRRTEGRGRRTEGVGRRA